MPNELILIAALVLSGVAAVAAIVAALRSFGGEASEIGDLARRIERLEAAQERAERGLADASALARRESGEASRTLREEVSASVERLSERMSKSLEAFAERTEAQSRRLIDSQKSQHESFETRLSGIGEAQRQTGETFRTAVETQLKTLREENTGKLEQMRVTVDEKLQGTLEARLGESFKIVSDRLEAVHKGLGEMQTLATGVGDLKRVLTNVKARGSWGEVQLGALLEQILTPGQFVTNQVMAATGADRVEFAILLPGSEEHGEIFLPIDAKFPIEDYERLQHAADSGDVASVEQAAKALETRLRQSARDISDKYVHPPRTTDFAIMFLPTEGLYAEAIKRPGLVDDLQRTYRIVVAGPTTLIAILSGLRMGFRSLAIQKRSSEVWQVLGTVKSEFGKFGPVLEKVSKKLQEASNHIDSAQRRNRAIERSLRSVEALPSGVPSTLVDALENDLLDEADADTVDSAYLHAPER